MKHCRIKLTQIIEVYNLSKFFYSQYFKEILEIFLCLRRRYYEL